MAGIYIHIPFCKSRCHYCAFYSTTNVEKASQYAKRVKEELSQRANYLTVPVETIYFGGGTPSLLSAETIEDILHHIDQRFKVVNQPEITLEANPDDLNPTYLHDILTAGVNRLSIGTQSTDDATLRLMNRRHNAKQSLAAIQQAQKQGFANISADLIYGFHVDSLEFDAEVKQLLETGIDHLSAYMLSVEEGTVFADKQQKGALAFADDEQCAEQYWQVIAKTREFGLEHYEVSNFARPGFISRHNSSYWKQAPYLGVGCAAHSYNIHSRRWNVSDLEAYLADKEGNEYAEETLSTEDRINDLLITTLRTNWGVDLAKVEREFGPDCAETLRRKAEQFSNLKHLEIKGNKIVLNETGFLFSDRIIAELFV